MSLPLLRAELWGRAVAAVEEDGAGGALSEQAAAGSIEGAAHSSGGFGRPSKEAVGGPAVGGCCQRRSLCAITDRHLRYN